MKIKALVLSEFHQNKGLKVVHVVPKDSVVTEKQFQLYSELILPKEELCGHLIVIQFMEKYYLLGIPSLSVNTSQRAPYLRNKYIYSVNILVEKELYLNESKRPLYKQISKKLSYFFKFVEETSNTIYNNENQSNLKYLSNIMAKAYKDLHQHNQCVLSHSARCYTIINLKTPPYQPIIKQIKKSSVPITFLTDAEIEDIQSEVGRKLLSFARVGDYNIRKIIESVQNEKQVFKFYEKAMRMGLVFIVDMFCLENRYCLTPVIHEYLPNCPKYEFLTQICEQIAKPKAKQQKRGKRSHGNHEAPKWEQQEPKKREQSKQQKEKIQPYDILKLYFQLSRKFTIKKIIEDNLRVFCKINILKWIRISQVLGIVRRVEQKFAVVGEEGQQFKFISYQAVQDYLERKSEQSLKRNLQDHGKGEDLPVQMRVNEQHEKLNSHLNHHLKQMDTIDEICVTLNVDKDTLFDLVNYREQKILKIFYVSQ